MLSTNHEKREQEIKTLASELTTDEINTIIALNSSEREAKAQERIKACVGSTDEIFDAMSTRLYYQSDVEYLPGRYATFRTLSQWQSERAFRDESNMSVLAYGMVKVHGEPVISDRLVRTDDMNEFLAEGDWQSHEEKWFDEAMNSLRTMPSMITGKLAVAFTIWQNAVYSKLEEDGATDDSLKKSTGA